MSASRVEYHQDAIADVKNAVAWYRQRSPRAALDFIEELNRQRLQSVKLRSAGQEEKTIQEDSCFGGFLSRLSIRKKNLQSPFGLSLMEADDRTIGHIAFRPRFPSPSNGKMKRFPNVLGLKVRVGPQNLWRFHTFNHHIKDSRHRYPQVSNAGNTDHLSRINPDSAELHFFPSSKTAAIILWSAKHPRNSRL